MLQLLRTLFYLVRELIFDHKDEYDFKSAQFNSRKVMVFVIVLLSFVTNGWLAVRFVNVANRYWDCQHSSQPLVETTVPEELPDKPQAKKLLRRSSDSEADAKEKPLPAQKTKEL